MIVTSRKHAYVFDLDGVLANTEHRLDMLNEGPDIFFKTMEDDTPIEATTNIYRSLYEVEHYYMIVLTGRPQRFYDRTADWLRNNNLQYDKLIMRPDGSDLTVMEYKVDTIKELIKQFYIMAVVEDNPLTAQYLREHTHAPVLLVSSGYYDPAGFGHDPREDKRW